MLCLPSSNDKRKVKLDLVAAAVREPPKRHHPTRPTAAAQPSCAGAGRSRLRRATSPAADSWLHTERYVTWC